MSLPLVTGLAGRIVCIVHSPLQGATTSRRRFILQHGMDA